MRPSPNGSARIPALRAGHARRDARRHRGGSGHRADELGGADGAGSCGARRARQSQRGRPEGRGRARTDRGVACGARDDDPPLADRPQRGRGGGDRARTSGSAGAMGHRPHRRDPRLPDRAPRSRRAARRLPATGPATPSPRCTSWRTSAAHGLGRVSSSTSTCRSYGPVFGDDSVSLAPRIHLLRVGLGRGVRRRGNRGANVGPGLRLARQPE